MLLNKNEIDEDDFNVNFSFLKSCWKKLYSGFYDWFLTHYKKRVCWKWYSVSISGNVYWHTLLSKQCQGFSCNWQTKPMFWESECSWCGGHHLNIDCKGGKWWNIGFVWFWKACAHKHIKIGLLSHGICGCLKKDLISEILVFLLQQWSKLLLNHSMQEKNLDTIRESVALDHHNSVSTSTTLQSLVIVSTTTASLSSSHVPAQNIIKTILTSFLMNHHKPVTVCQYHLKNPASSGKQSLNFI